MNAAMDEFAYSAEILIDIRIAEANYLQIQGFKDFCAELVCFLLFREIVAAAVQFDNQPGFGTIEISDEISDGFLSLESDGIIAQKIIP